MEYYSNKEETVTNIAKRNRVSRESLYAHKALMEKYGYNLKTIKQDLNENKVKTVEEAKELIKKLQKDVDELVKQKHEIEL